ncbi:MAG: AAA family ATPase [Gammaproteobacteria bacterium]|nr:AAA family ATPase [Gammaproteobacteria bacterium]
MKLTVKNFGPIREARNIDISPMTIFVGPSNTGKSYLAMLIYSIFEVFSDEEYAWRIFRLIEKENRNYPENFSNQEVSQDIVSKQIEPCFSLWAQAVSDVWKQKVVYCFGEEGKNVIEGKNSSEDFSVRLSDPEDQFILDLTAPANSKITLKKSRQLSGHINLIIALSMSDRIEEYTYQVVKADGSHETHKEVMPQNYTEIIIQQFELNLFPWKPLESVIDAYYLPAIRGGIMQSHRALVSALIKRAPMAGLDSIPAIPPFNGVLSDFMTKLINSGSGEFDGSSFKGRQLTRRRRHKGRDRFADELKKLEAINRRLERRILSGEIDIQRSEAQYPDFRYKFTRDDKKYDLPLMSASSSVSELAPVSLFIRHYVCPGDLLIVEEPEAHLHPAAQRDISDVLARLVNAGVNVLVTTHSDNILEQVSNFIYAADLPESKLTKLDEKKCSVYLFKPGRGGNKTTVRKIPFDPETGLVTQDHLDVSSALYNETVNLMEKRENAGSQTDI